MSRGGDGIDLSGGAGRRSGSGREEAFRGRLGRLRRDNPELFINRVNKAVAKARAASGRTKLSGSSGRFNARGRGAKVAPGLKGHGAWQIERGMRFRARRVIVKARVVKLAGAGSRAAHAHLRYLQREGAGLDRNAGDGRAGERAATLEHEPSAPSLAAPSEEAAKRKDGPEIAPSPDIERDAAGDRGALYSSFDDAADARAFLKRGEKDRHQFRFIVSPEDGAELGDLRPFTRGLMREMERDLGTRLDWVAVDHYDTGHPHVHVVVRGVTDDGKTLNIAGDYIAHGIRARASERLTLELGHQSEWEVMKKLGREATADRFTRLDRELSRLAGDSPDNTIDLRPGRALEKTERLRINKHLLIARAKHLEKLGLAERMKPGVWTLAPDAEEILRRLGERGDIIKGIHRAMGREGIAHARQIAEDAPAAPVIGRIIGKELGGDELKGDLRLIVDGADGRVRAVEVSATSEAAEARVGAVIEIGPPRLKPADKAIAEIAANNAGIYDPQAHGAKLVETMEIEEARDLALAHVRRLEALRRQGIVERRENGDWSIPEDFAGKVLDHEARAGGRTSVRVLSALSLEAQLQSDGATWLDRTLVKGESVASLTAAGFGGDVRRALHARQEKLIGEGLAERVSTPDGEMIRYRRNLLAALARRELMRAGAEMARAKGKEFVLAEDGARIGGAYRGAVQLASGRYALVERSKEFTLVPWRPVLEKELGRQVAGIVRGSGVSWTFGRQRGLGIGM